MYRPILTNMKDVPNWEGQYAVTKDGRVWAYPRHRICGATKLRGPCTKFYEGKWLSQATTKQGYKRVNFWKDGKLYSQKIHTLVAATYIPKVLGKDIINHKNGIKNDNRVENLEWCTYKENTQHAFNMGLVVALRGEKHGMARFTDDTIKEMRKLYSNGVNRSKLAKKFNTSKTHMNRIVKREIWKHVL